MDKLDEFLLGKSFNLDQGITNQKYKILKRISKGSQSTIYLIESISWGMNTLKEQIIAPNQAFVLKAYRNGTAKEVSTNVINVKRKGRELWAQARDRNKRAGESDKIYPEEEMHLDDTAVCALITESKTLCELNEHYPNLFIELIEFRTDLPLRVAVFEYGGKTLEERLRNDFIDADSKISIIHQLFQSVYALQSRRIIHKDISPNNIIIDEDGRMKLIDFSLAQKIDKKIFRFGKYEFNQLLETREGYGFNHLCLFLGNRLYRPPETYEGYLSCRHDVWSAGLIAFALLTGEHLIPISNKNQYGSGAYAGFTKKDKRVYTRCQEEMIRTNKPRLQNLINERVYGNNHLPKEYKNVIAKCCSVNPRTRTDMKEVLNELGISSPIYRKERKNHWKEEQHKVIDGNCKICELHYISRWNEKRFEEYGPIPERYFFKGKELLSLTEE